MSTAERDLNRFNEYARRQIAAGGDELSLDELFDQWRLENPTEEEYAKTVAAVRASLDDFERGERGALAGEHSARLRERYGITDS